MRARAAGQGWPLCEQALLAGTPRGLEFDSVKEVLLGVSGVKGAHNLHLWALTLSHHAVSVHVAVGECPMHGPASSRSPQGMAGGDPLAAHEPELSHAALQSPDASADPETVLREATTQLQSKFGFASCTVQVERYWEETAACQHCQDPCA